MGKRKMPDMLWVSIFILGVIEMNHILRGEPKSVGSLILGLVITVALMIGIFLGQKWAYVAELVLASVQVIWITGESTGKGIVALLVNCLVAAPMILSTRYFFPRKTKPDETGTAEGGERGTLNLDGTEVKENQQTHKRRIWAAILLSLGMPGLGQIYCGKLKRGLLFFFLCVLEVPLVAGLFHLSDDTVVIPIALFLSLAVNLVCLLFLLDAAFLARRMGENYSLKNYNRILVYILFILAAYGVNWASKFYLKDRIVDAFIIPTASCYPTIVPQDRILANKCIYKRTEPQRGDLVVFLHPDNCKEIFMKRVTAVAGDTVEIKDGELYVNEEKLPRQKLDASLLDKIRIQLEGKPLEGELFEESNSNVKYRILLAKGGLEELKNYSKRTIPRGHYFLLGDNRNRSFDSREFGPVPLANIIGRADFIYWPAQDWSRLGRISR